MNVINLLKYYYKICYTKFPGKSGEARYSIRVYTYDIPAILDDIYPYLRHNLSRADLVREIIDIKRQELRVREVSQENNRYKPDISFYEKQEELFQKFQAILKKSANEFSSKPILLSPELDYYYI